MKILECVRLSRSYGEHAALKECSLTLEEGRMHVLLGPSGCGKSTLLEVLAGLQPCAQGTIRLHGEDVSAMPPQQRRMAMVFQTPACFPHMSVKENIMFASPAQDEKAEKKAREIAAMLKIDHLLERRASALSGGEKQRTAIARALMKDADIILMDEPFSALDAPLARALGEELCRLQRHLSLSILYVTHDQQEAMRMADQMFLMHEGRIIQEGTPLQLYKDPRSLFAARFLCSELNVIAADVQEGQLRFGEMKLAVPFPLPQGKLLMAIRPEHVRLGTKGWPGARIDESRRSGALYHIRAAWLGQTWQIVSLALPSGDQISFDPADCLFFDPHTGLRIQQ